MFTLVILCGELSYSFMTRCLHARMYMHAQAFAAMDKKYVIRKIEMIA